MCNPWVNEIRRNKADEKGNRHTNEPSSRDKARYVFMQKEGKKKKKIQRPIVNPLDAQGSIIVIADLRRSGVCGYVCV